MKVRALIRFFAILCALVALFSSLPSPIDPLLYDAPEPPEMSGPLAPNTALREVEVLGKGEVEGPEDVAVDAAGRIYGACEDGTIRRLVPEGDGYRTELFATTGGRPLGLHFDTAGDLIVADRDRGLLAINPEGEVKVLATGAGDVPFAFADDLDIASDGRIYFSDASSKHSDYLYDLLEARPWGRLLRHDPATGITEVLLEDLYFANGIALSQNEDFVLINETYRYRIRRYWLTGPRAGSDDIFLDNLPGFPDGVSANRQGTFWVALFTVRNPRADKLHRRPFVKRQLAKLPKMFWPKPAPYGLVLAVDESGRILRSLQDPGGEVVPQVTSAEEVDGVLYLGNLGYDFLARLPVGQ
jgi:sugar lactone lactonase YvrE